MKFTHLPTFVAVVLTLSIFGALTAQASPQDYSFLTGAQEDVTSDTIQDLSRPQVNVKDEPDPVIDKRLVGWTAAGFGFDGGRVSDDLRANWIVLNPNDGIDGRVLGIAEEVNVYLLRDGFVVGEAITGADGSFTLESASEGPYTIFGYAPDAVFAYSFLAIANDAGVSGQPLSIATLPVGGRENTKLITKLVTEYSPTVKFREYGIYDIGEEPADPPRYYGFAGFRTFAQPTLPATSIQHHQVAILNDGRFIGRLHAMHNRSGRPVEVMNSRVLIIQNGELLADTQVDNKGVFEIAGLPAGEYGLVAVGADGFGTIGLELVNGGPNMGVSQPQTSNEYDPLFRQISASQQVEPTRLDMAMVNPDSMGWINAHMQEASYFDAMTEPLPEMRDFSQMPYNYFNNGANCGNGYGGGGGGYGGYQQGGGFGDFGGWIWPIALAWTFSEASNNNNNVGVGGIRLISPFNP
ncbi:MAG: carboxypeptidase-like regulatory domain-containing protein [Pirellulaceae bacterium]